MRFRKDSRCVPDLIPELRAAVVREHRRDRVSTSITRFKSERMEQPSQTEIRPATADDARAVAACVNAAYAMYIERMGKPPAPMLADYDALIAQQAVWVLPGDERLRGILVMMPRGDHLFLENIAVYPDDQGKGLGRRLMAFIEQQARALGLPAIELYTNEAMTENLAFYPRLGFVEVSRQVEDGYRRVFMRKTLIADSR